MILNKFKLLERRKAHFWGEQGGLLGILYILYAQPYDKSDNLIKENKNTLNNEVTPNGSVWKILEKNES